MNLALLLPSALLALSALLIPLLIHLSRRSEQKPTEFAALRWISTQLRPRRKLVFQEILLLLLRLLLLIALAFLLARPISMHAVARENWVVVIPGVDIGAAKNLPFDKSAKWRWLAPGFPDFEMTPVASNLAVASLLRELDARLPANTALTIIAPERLSGLDGERIRLSRKIEWKIVPGRTPTSSSPDNPTAMRVAIRHDEKHLDAAIYFRAAHTAWQSEQKAGQKDPLDIADISSPLKPDRSVLVWLSTGQLPGKIREWASKGGTLIISKDSVVPEMKSGVSAWRNDNGKALVQAAALGQGRVLQWQQDLKPSTMPELLDADFPEHLKSLLQAKPPAPGLAFADSQTPLAGAKAGADTPQSLQIWLALLIAALFLLERWFANSSRRWSAA